MEELALTTYQSVILIFLLILLLLIALHKKTTIDIEITEIVEENIEPEYLSRYGRVIQM